MKLQLWAQQECTGCVRTCLSVRTVPTHSVRTMRIVRTIARTACVYFIFVIMNFKTKCYKKNADFTRISRKNALPFPAWARGLGVMMRARECGLLGETILGT